jgi:hypothetical protein
VQLSIPINQLDSHEANCRELSHLQFEPNWSTNFGFGQNPKKKITVTSQEDLRTFTPLVSKIDTVFSVRYALKIKTTGKITLAFYEISTRGNINNREEDLAIYDKSTRHTISRCLREKCSI